MTGRPVLLLTAFWLAIAGLITRLYVLQIQQNEKYVLKAERKRRRVIFEPSRRGRILDRNGRVLAVDQPQYDLVADLTEIDPCQDLLRRLSRALGLSRKQMIQTIELARRSMHKDDKYVLLAQAKTSRAQARLESLLARQKKVFRSVYLSCGLDLEESIIKGLPDHWIALAVPVLTARDRNLDTVAKLLNLDSRILVQRVSQKIRAILNEEDVNVRLKEWSTPFVVVGQLSFEHTLILEERLFELTGLSIRKKFERFYPQADSACHILGKVSQLTAETVDKLAQSGLVIDLPNWYQRKLERKLGPNALPWPVHSISMGVTKKLPEKSILFHSKRGVNGLERKFEPLLAGHPGARVIERDSKGRQIGILIQHQEKHGRDLRTTLDLQLQKTAEKALDAAVARHGDEKAGGAAVVMRIEDGAILTLASSPRYDINRFNKDYKKISADTHKPQFNRATSHMPPGSTYKILSTLAFFDPSRKKHLNINHQFHCIGRLSTKIRRFKCDGTHNAIGLERAIAHSCNVFYWKALWATDYENSLTWAERLGFGRRISDAIPGERSGAIPGLRDFRKRMQLTINDNPEPGKAKSKKLNFLGGGVGRPSPKTKKKKKRANTKRLNEVIGQGRVTATPIQVARLASFIATEGDLIQPRIFEESPIVKSHIDIPDFLIRRIKQGMRGCVKYGTARRTALVSMDVAGKTGTAERNPGQPQYAWFMCYYPASQPKLAIAVVIDRTAGHGGGVAGPVAHAIIREFQRLEIKH